MEDRIFGIFTQIWEQISPFICWTYLVIFMLLSYIVKKYFTNWLMKVTKMKWKLVYTVLILATVVAIPFLLLKEGCTWVNILLSYTLGTSLHELIFTLIEKKISQILQIVGNSDPQSPLT